MSALKHLRRAAFAKRLPGRVLAANREARRRAWLAVFYSATPNDSAVSRQVSRRTDFLWAKKDARDQARLDARASLRASRSLTHG